MSKSLGNLKINNAKKIEKINRTCQNTAPLAARAMHGTVTDIGKVDVDGLVKQQFPNQKMKAEHAQIQRGEQGVRNPPPLENPINVGFLSKTDPNPLKITNLPSQHSMLCHHRHASDVSLAD